MAVQLWQAVAGFVGSAGTGAGIFWGYQNSQTSKKVLDNTKDRQARADERQSISDERQSLADERSAWAAQREAQQKEFEQLLLGYKGVADELKTELSRVTTLVRDCESERAGLREEMMQVRQELAELKGRHYHRRASDQQDHRDRADSPGGPHELPSDDSR